MNNWLTELATYHRNDNDILRNAFGVLLYTDAHPIIKKIINDIDYWKAFHEQSGDKWNIYCVKAKTGKHEYPSFPPGTMGMMVSIWKEPEDNKEILDFFKIKDTKSPYFVFFNFTDDEDYILSHAHEIREINPDLMYSDLRDLIQQYTDIVNGVWDENAQEGRTMHIYAGIQNSFKTRVSMLTKLLNIAERLKSILG
ncbi:hypothetical protein [Citrobacter sp. Cy230]|uniref:hypothetical protein n=1 Tax=Citrobacter sp. Cy230 TaxID=2985163 RepID=UPI00257581AB|nr:hypothetical protein [Citrobacter sp. Cy230]MDM2719935.1 hypothetical protein [Citrobacter sp. Cy230]